MENIIRRASGIDLSATRTTHRAISNSGVARTESASPIFYYLDVQMPIMTQEQYDLTQDDLIDLDYGVEFSVPTTMPFGLTRVANPTYWDSDTVTSNRVAAQTGRTIILDGFPAAGRDVVDGLRRGDYIQFDYSGVVLTTNLGANKVYQLSENATINASGQATVTLNTPVIIPVPNNIRVRSGAEVRFRWLLSSVPTSQSIPGASGSVLYSYQDAFTFREVL